eukprot:6111978-Alexandrium_andersonii.AAC.1
MEKFIGDTVSPGRALGGGENDARHAFPRRSRVFGPLHVPVRKVAVQQDLRRRWARRHRRPELTAAFPHDLVDALLGGMEAAMRADASHRRGGREEALA